MSLKIAHISLYPPKGAKHVEGSGVISYTKNLVGHIDKDIEQHMLTNRIEGQTEAYQEDGITVHRCFDRGPLFIWQLHQELKKIQPDVIHIQQEIPLYGNIVTAVLLQFLVLVWKDKMTLTMHHVVNPEAIDKEFVRQNNSNAPAWIVQLAFKIIFKPLIRYSQQIIVHELMFKHILIDGYGAAPSKVAVIPHGVEDLKASPVDKSRKQLGLKKDSQVALYMGYASGYKGLDLLIEGFAEYAKNHPKAYLIIGAGKHPKLLNDAAYLAKYRAWQDKASKMIPKEQFRWVGFIEEAKIGQYYSASDVSIYPYTTTLSSSGPMALAIGYEKPFLGSSVFNNIFGSYQQLLFDRKPQSMADRLEHFFNHQESYQGISAELKQQRIWATVGHETSRIYENVDLTNKERAAPVADNLLEDEIE